MQKSLAVIINSYNRCDLLTSALESIDTVLKNGNFLYQIIIVDAGSTDGSIEYIAAYPNDNDSINLIKHSGTNPLTFSEGCNLGADYAFTLNPLLDYLLFYETDNYIKDAAPLINAFKLIELVKASCVGFTVEKFSGAKTSFGKAKPTLLKYLIGQKLSLQLGVNKLNLNWVSLDKVTFTACDIVFTSPLLVKGQVWREVIGMDSKRFPFSESDSDLCLQFLSHGYKNLVIQAEGVIHDNKNVVSSWSANRRIDYYIANYSLLLKHSSISGSLLKILSLIKFSIELCGGYLFSKPNSFMDSRRKLLEFHLRKNT